MVSSVCAAIVTYNRRDLLIECVRGIINQSYKVSQIIIINNNSPYDVKADFLNYENVEVIDMKSNLGGAGGFSKAVDVASQSGADFVWLMDDDCEPMPDALQNALNLINPEVAAVSSVKIGLDGNIQDTHWGNYDPKSFSQNFIDFNSGIEFFKIGYGSFVGLLFRSSAVAKVGLPRSDFFIWFDDIEYCLRLGELGQILLCKSSKFLHKDISNYEDRLPLTSYLKRYYGFRNQVLILRERENIIITFMLSLLRLLRLILGILLKDENKLIKMKLLICGFADGILGKSGFRLDPSQYLSNLKGR